MKTTGNALPFVTIQTYLFQYSAVIVTASMYGNSVVHCDVKWSPRNISNLHLVRELGMTDPSITSLTADEYKEAYIFTLLIKAIFSIAHITRNTLFSYKIIKHAFK